MHSKFGKVRDSIRSRRNSFRNQLKDKKQTLRRSFRENRNSIRNKLQNSPYVMRYTQNSFGTPSHVSVGTNTDFELPDSNVMNSKIVDPSNMYPALPRYN